MNENKKWNYEELTLNLTHLENKNKTNEIFEVVDNANKVELDELFSKGLKNNYVRYRKYFYQQNLFLFRELKYNIKQSIHCLIIEAYSASITLTNHILERAVKLAIIQIEVGKLPFDEKNMIKHYIEADKKYSNKSLKETVQQAYKYNLLNKKEKKELLDYKIKFRDGFSHFSPANILKNENNIIYTSVPLDNNENPNFKKIPMYQASLVTQFAVNNAEKHLAYVLKVINQLQFKIIEYFRTNENKENLARGSAE